MLHNAGQAPCSCDARRRKHAVVSGDRPILLHSSLRCQVKRSRHSRPAPDPAPVHSTPPSRSVLASGLAGNILHVSRSSDTPKRPGGRPIVPQEMRRRMVPKFLATGEGRGYDPFLAQRPIPTTLSPSGVRNHERPRPWSSCRRSAALCKLPLHERGGQSPWSTPQSSRSRPGGA